MSGAPRGMAGGAGAPGPCGAVAQPASLIAPICVVAAINWPSLLRMPTIHSTPNAVPCTAGLTAHRQENTMTRIRQAVRQNQTTLLKTGSYYAIHICVAAMVAYAVTGNLWASLTLSLLEPTVQAVAFFFHEKAWDRAARRQANNTAVTAVAA